MSGGAPSPGRDLSGDLPAIAGLLGESRRIAVVGASADPFRPSHDVALALVRLGYPVIAVNPTIAGTTLFGAPVAASLADVDPPVDIVDIFRRSAAAGAAIDAAIAERERLGIRAVWLQLGIADAAACARARAAGLDVVTNRCLKIEAARRGGAHR